MCQWQTGGGDYWSSRCNNFFCPDGSGGEEHASSGGAKRIKFVNGNRKQESYQGAKSSCGTGHGSALLKAGHRRLRRYFCVIMHFWSTQRARAREGEGEGGASRIALLPSLSLSPVRLPMSSDVSLECHSPLFSLVKVKALLEPWIKVRVRVGWCDASLCVLRAASPLWGATTA